MKTHNLFGFSVALWLSLKMLELEILYSVVLSAYLSTAVNTMIDRVGGHRGFRRTPYTHSILGSALVSVVVAVPLILFIFALGIPRGEGMVQGILALSLVAGFAHLFLDMLTVDGVPLVWPLSVRRYRLARVRYDSVLANGLIIAASLAIVAVLVLEP